MEALTRRISDLEHIITQERQAHLQALEQCARTVVHATDEAAAAQMRCERLELELKQAQAALAAQTAATTLNAKATQRVTVGTQTGDFDVQQWRAQVEADLKAQVLLDLQQSAHEQAVREVRAELRQELARALETRDAAERDLRAATQMRARVDHDLAAISERESELQRREADLTVRMNALLSREHMIAQADEQRRLVLAAREAALAAKMAALQRQSESSPALRIGAPGRPAEIDAAEAPPPDGDADSARTPDRPLLASSDEGSEVQSLRSDTESARSAPSERGTASAAHGDALAPAAATATAVGPRPTRAHVLVPRLRVPRVPSPPVEAAAAVAPAASAQTPGDGHMAPAAAAAPPTAAGKPDAGPVPDAPPPMSGPPAAVPAVAPPPPPPSANASRPRPPFRVGGARAAAGAAGATRGSAAPVTRPSRRAPARPSPATAPSAGTPVSVSQQQSYAAALRVFASQATPAAPAGPHTPVAVRSAPTGNTDAPASQPARNGAEAVPGGSQAPADSTGARTAAAATPDARGTAFRPAPLSPAPLLTALRAADAAAALVRLDEVDPQSTPPPSPSAAPARAAVGAVTSRTDTVARLNGGARTPQSGPTAGGTSTAADTRRLDGVSPSLQQAQEWVAAQRLRTQQALERMQRRLRAAEQREAEAQTAREVMERLVPRAYALRSPSP